MSDVVTFCAAAGIANASANTAAAPVRHMIRRLCVIRFIFLPFSADYRSAYRKHQMQECRLSASSH